MMLGHRDLLTLSLIIMNEILEPDESPQPLDRVDYGSEWEDAMKKLTISFNNSIHIQYNILNE